MILTRNGTYDKIVAKETVSNATILIEEVLYGNYNPQNEYHKQVHKYIPQ